MKIPKTLDELIENLGWTNMANELQVILKKITDNFSTFLTDAPIDGSQYARQDGGWTEVNTSGFDPSNYDLIDFNNDDADPFAHISDVISGSTPNMEQVLGISNRPIKIVEDASYTFVEEDKGKYIILSGTTGVVLNSGIFSNGDTLLVYNASDDVTESGTASVINPSVLFSNSLTFITRITTDDDWSLNCLHITTKEEIGLGNTDDTSDLDKPISTATQDALDALSALFIENFNDARLKQPVKVATTDNIILSGNQTIDGINSNSSRILVKNQTDPTENGIYFGVAGAWARTLDANEDYEDLYSLVDVLYGNVNGGKRFLQDSLIATQRVYTEFRVIPKIASDLDALNRNGSNANTDLDIGDNSFSASQVNSVAGFSTTGGDDGKGINILANEGVEIITNVNNSKANYRSDNLASDNNPRIQAPDLSDGDYTPIFKINDIIPDISGTAIIPIADGSTDGLMFKDDKTKLDSLYTTPYLLYAATLTQSGGSDPAVTVIFNNTGNTFSWIRGSTGNYHADIGGNVTPIIQDNSVQTGLNNSIKCYFDSVTSPNSVYIVTSALSVGLQVASDNVLNNTYVEIKIWQ